MGEDVVVMVEIAQEQTTRDCHHDEPLASPRRGGIEGSRIYNFVRMSLEPCCCFAFHFTLSSCTIVKAETITKHLFP